MYIANAYDLLAFAASQKSGKRSIGAILKWVFKPFIKLYNAIKNAWSKVSPVTKVGSAIGTAGYGKQKQSPTYLGHLKYMLCITITFRWYLRDII